MAKVELNAQERARQVVAEALLATANSGSQHVAVLHVAFMALCAYVLVIVFGTTDMDLLIGKGVKLPVVDVTVPIVGFYAFAPYLVVLVHFNLLLQLLSRQLYGFDAAAPKEERIGGLRDRLHIFPYTYYLVGRPGPIVRAAARDRDRDHAARPAARDAPGAATALPRLPGPGRHLGAAGRRVVRRRPGDRPLAGHHGSGR